VRLLDDANLELGELRLTRPSLDDVFLRATGHHLEADKASGPAQGAV